MLLGMQPPALRTTKLRKFGLLFEKLKKHSARLKLHWTSQFGARARAALHFAARGTKRNALARLPCCNIEDISERGGSGAAELRVFCVAC